MTFKMRLTERHTQTSLAMAWVNDFLNNFILKQNTIAVRIWAWNVHDARFASLPHIRAER